MYINTRPNDCYIHCVNCKFDYGGVCACVCVCARACVRVCETSKKGFITYLMFQYRLQIIPSVSHKMLLKPISAQFKKITLNR
jgi:hypothetical protein